MKQRTTAERAFDRETARLQRRCVWREHELTRISAELAALKAELAERAGGRGCDRTAEVVS